MNATQQRVLAFIDALEQRHGEARPRIPGIASALELSEATVHRALRTLKVSGFLKVRKRRTRSGRQLASKYEIQPLGKVALLTVTGVSLDEAANMPFHSEQIHRGVSPKNATGVSGVSPKNATGVSLDDVASTASGAALRGGEGVTENSDTAVKVTPLNKEHPERTGGSPSAEKGAAAKATTPMPEACLRYIEMNKREPTELEKQLKIILASPKRATA